MSITRLAVLRRPKAPQAHRDAAAARRVVVIVAVEPAQGRENIGEPNRMVHAGNFTQSGTGFDRVHVGRP
ncbi:MULTISPECIES: hypothetical protein [Bradyrhizobium]|uniref:hypothetical protein n=1 Tax=unclassified Bradyrhizobium TaxID=2631580 RepID=UPI00293F65FE|nr:hypothetical protein [Bradyrhizobium sp. BWC-3-1]WOH60437.1 hypothetical protein RX329_10230 [Bradyrhizobium sp. BWC-3-1]